MLLGLCDRLEYIYDRRRRERALPQIVTQSKIASNYMFKKTDGLGLHQLVHHVAENGAYRIEALISMAYIGQASLVEQYLLHDEDGYSFRQFRASLHDPETKRNNFG